MLSALIHRLDPFLIRFPTNPWIEGIRWYGVAYLVSFWLAWRNLPKATRFSNIRLTYEQQSSFMMSLILGVLIGGRMGYVLLYDLKNLLADPLLLVRFWNGGISGMSSHGGFMGVAIAMVFFSRRHHISLLAVTDSIAILTPLGLFFGRIANFINGELWGRATTVPWAMIFPKAHDLLPRHPSQLYEALLEGLFLFVWTRKRMHSSLKRGQMTAEFLIVYALLRMCVECFREPDASLIGPLSRGQFYSLFLIGLGLFLFVFSKYFQSQAPETPHSL